MKKTLLLMACLTLAVATYAQTGFESEVKFIQEAYGQEKRMMVANFVEVPEAQSTEFWALYDAYETERATIGTSRVENLTEYAEAFDGMTDEQADAITKSILANRAAQEKLYKKYFGKMKKAVGAKTALQFLELEVYLQTAITMSILDTIPFVGE